MFIRIFTKIKYTYILYIEIGYIVYIYMEDQGKD